MSAGAEAAPTFPRLFEPCRMAGVTLRNRIVLAGHGSRFVDGERQTLTERQAAYLAERAKGGTGLIIQGSAMVHPTGLALPGVQEAWSEESVAANAAVSEAVHEHGAAIFGQLSHLGRQGHSFTSQRELWAPSAVADASHVVPHAMTRAEIATITDAYRSAAVRFMRAGFDGIEVYLAHGYLLFEFVSPYSNRRTDAYGGSLENRMRLPLEIIAAVRAEVGRNVPVGIRVSAEEFVTGGLTVPETKEMVERFVEREQLEYVSVSQSNWSSIETMIPDMSFPRGAFVKYAGEIREVTGEVPVMAVARIVTPERCEAILEDGLADLICLVRPLIADPEFANKAAEGHREEIRECISCNVGCRGGPHRGLPVMCLVNPAWASSASGGSAGSHARTRRAASWSSGARRRASRPPRRPRCAATTSRWWRRPPSSAARCSPRRRPCPTATSSPTPRGSSSASSSASTSTSARACARASGP